MTSSKAKMLDIAMNLNRVGNWAADDYAGKKDRIKAFLANTSDYIADFEYPESIADTINVFKNEYKTLKLEGSKGPKDPLIWAEKMMTWGNILTHRSQLIVEDIGVETTQEKQR